MYTINMLSKADMVKGQGVASAHDEQVKLAKEVLQGRFEILENSHKGCDITHIHTINPEFFIRLPFIKHRGMAVGYVHFLPETLENSIHLPKAAKKIFYKYVLTFYKQMDHLVTVNPYFIDVLEKYGIPREKVSYIPNFVSEEQFYPLSADEKSTLREKYHLPKDRFTVLCAGQLQLRKGIMDFFALAKRMPDVEFIWAGGFSFGKISDGYEEIKKEMEHLPENVRMLGLLDREVMNEVYNMADVMFLPSYEELFPMTILEAMNCRIPILVRDLDIYDNILFDYVQRGQDINEFQSLLQLLNQDKSFYEYAASCAFEGHEFYSRAHVGQMWANFYEDTVQAETERAWGFDKRKEAYQWK